MKERLHSTHKLLSKAAKEVRASAELCPTRGGTTLGPAGPPRPCPSENQAAEQGLGVSLAVWDMLCTQFSQSQRHVLKKHCRKQKQLLEVSKGWLIFSPREIKN